MDINSFSPFCIEFGSSLVKAGVCGTRVPSSVFFNGLSRGSYCGDPFEIIGNVVKELYDDVSVQKPIERGKIENFESFCRVWKHALGMTQQQQKQAYPMLVILDSCCRREEKKQVFEFAFEEIGAPSMYIGSPPPLALFANGRTTGVVWDVGGACNSVDVVVNGFCVPYANDRTYIAGDEIDGYLHEMLSVRYPEIVWSSSGKFRLEKWKTKFCHVNKNDRSPEDETLELFYLPDGRSMGIVTEKTRCCEPLFSPKLIQRDFVEWNIQKLLWIGRNDINSVIHEMPKDVIKFIISKLQPQTNGPAQRIRKCIRSIDQGYGSELYKNIVMCGGSTMFRGMEERFEFELSNENLPLPLRGRKQKERQYLSWIGGSVLGEMSAFGKVALSKADYEEIY